MGKWCGVTDTLASSHYSTGDDITIATIHIYKLFSRPHKEHVLSHVLHLTHLAMNIIDLIEHTSVPSMRMMPLERSATLDKNRSSS